MNGCIQFCYVFVQGHRTASLFPLGSHFFLGFPLSSMIILQPGGTSRSVWNSAKTRARQI